MRYLYSAGSYTNIIPPGAVYSFPVAINASGQITGISGTSTGNTSLNYLYSAGTYTTITAPETIQSNGFTAVNGMNNAGQVVGYYQTTNFGPTNIKGFLYSGGSSSIIAFPGV